MKRMNFRQKMRPAAIVVITAFCMLPLKGAGQKSETEKNIDNIRKGEIIIKARPKAKVQVEQTAHEFWFGCAIPSRCAKSTTTLAMILPAADLRPRLPRCLSYSCLSYR